ncbi:MAG: DUF2059 domain-containing protein [Gammaproteobacteria bacterium]|nr:DUF2059 domain-containing protein [Gammaproteobacteria bacterium]
MFRLPSFVLLLAASSAAFAGAGVDFDTAGRIYLAAGLREQVSASLPAMPGKLRDLFTSGGTGTLDAKRLAAVDAAAHRAFRIDVFEPQALAAFAAHLDPDAAARTLAFLSSPTGQRMVRDDIALAKLDEKTIDAVAQGKIAVPSSPSRARLFARLETASRATESAATVYLTIGRSIAVGKALGYGLNLEEAEQEVDKGQSTQPSAALEHSLEQPLGRYLAYGYRDLSERDLRRMVAFFESAPGKTYVDASIAALSAGFQSMGRRCGERIGESWRELARAEAQDRAGAAAPASLAAPGTPAAPVPKPR